MNQKVKKMWVAALRSGKYKQGKGKLCYGNQNGTKYCCLGVAADLAVKNGVCSRREAFADNAELTPKVMEWAGLSSADPRVKDYCLSTWNDDGDMSFKEIASLIDKNL